jgi:hypothetical protein
MAEQREQALPAWRDSAARSAVDAAGPVDLCATATPAGNGIPSRRAALTRLPRHAPVIAWVEDGDRAASSFAVLVHTHRTQAMNALAANAQTPDDTRLWSPSLVEAVGTGIPKQDPLALLLAEQQRDGALLRLVLSATAAVLILVVGAGVLI